jgi:hypothetical protein
MGLTVPGLRKGKVKLPPIAQGGEGLLQQEPKRAYLSWGSRLTYLFLGIEPLSGARTDLLLLGSEVCLSSAEVSGATFS